MDRRAASRGDGDEGRRARGTEVFVGGLPRAVTERALREVFSSCGEIVDLRIMKDQNGISKGYGFVRFAEKECAYIAKRQKNGFEIQGKRLAVDLSSDQDTLYLGNLSKEWSAEDFEELILKTFKDVVSVDLAMAQNLDSSMRKRCLNRGFAFVQFSSHSAAARVLRIGSRTDFVLGGLHPTINWADKESHVDDDEMAKSKTAFVGNLPAKVSEEYLAKLFEHCGEVERVAVSRKGKYPVGFVHFTSRAELDDAIKEMDGKSVRGPDRGPAFRIQVSVARPVENDKKRIREEVKPRRSNVTRDRPDYSYERHGHDSLNRQAKAQRLSNAATAVSDISHITNPYEAAVISLPSAVKELFLRILRLGIGTRYDIDIHCVKSLNELPEKAAVAVLNQFLISGADKHNKGDYFASLIAKYQAETFGSSVVLQGSTYLPRNPEMQNRRYTHEDYDYTPSGSSRYSSVIDYPSSSYLDDSTVSQSRIRRYAEERPDVASYPNLRLRREEIASIGRYPEPRLVHEPRQDTGRHLDQRYIHEQDSSITRLAGGADLSRERRYLSTAAYKTDVGIEFSSRSPAEYSTSRQQLKFDPFTGVPYKFDPFTGEPIRPESYERRSGSLY